ncbi:MAG: prolyl oligopeptidase family serine peptidase [Puia sp.]|nr:prolyl oligopeptidase family serine peptidase [Puia sp.]
MRIFFCALFFGIWSCSLCAQNKLLDHSTPFNWPILNSVEISNDGHFLNYKIIKANQASVLIIQSTSSSWKKEIPGAITEIQFTENSRWLLFRNADDSIGIFDLSKDSLYYITNAGSFEISNGRHGQWMAYKNNRLKNSLSIIDLFTGNEKRYFNVHNYLFSNSGNVLVIQTEVTKDSFSRNVVLWHNLLYGKDTVISDQNGTNNFLFDNSGASLVFLSTEENGNQSMKVLRYYHSGMDSSKILVSSNIPGMECMVIADRKSIYFSPGDDKVFFYAEDKNQKHQSQPSDNMPQVNVLSYFDDRLQFERMNGPSLFMIDLHDGKCVKRLGQAKDRGSYYSSKGDDDNYIVFESNVVGTHENYKWRQSANPDIYLVSTKDGTRKLLKKRLITNDLHFSWMGKYVIWYDRVQRNWFAYNIARKSLVNITHKIYAPTYVDDDHPDLPNPVGIAGWMTNDEAVLIYDRWDIWRVDPNGIKPPINLTHGYGFKNNISLRCLDINRGNPIPFHEKDTLLLAALNLNSKDNGFFKMPLNRGRDPERLSMESSVYYFPGIRADISGATDLFFPLKAKSRDTYIVRRMSAKEYPNLYITNDFKEFRSLTELAPQNKFNWYTSELIHWKLSNGMTAEGILYKPENFDPRKKYPVIFYYYEKNSNALNVFIHPQWSNGLMNIPWFVSNGYVVFVPNIYFKVGDVGESVYNSIISGAKYLSTKPWVDVHHMGLQGHSFGGWETDYIITRTSIFAAAASASGVTDLIRSYEDGLPEGVYYERGQGRIGVTIWKNLKLYIKDSPFFNAGQVHTPLLIMHTKEDGTVAYQQGKQWYNALARLGKKVWILSYGGEDHTIDKEANEIDYSIRLGQFFNYFLKGDLPPKWITQGIIPDSESLGYELDNKYENH